MKKILVIGSSNTDMTVVSDRLPAPGETVLGGVFHMGPGGKGANQAVCASRLGADVTFVCKVGNDIFGDNALAGYRAEGLDVSYVLRSAKPTGSALILVDRNGENEISVAPGANADFTVEDIDRLEDVICGADYLLLQLEIPVPCVVRAAEIAHAAGVFVILNPAPACALPPQMSGNVSLMMPNRTELELLAGKPVDSAAHIREAVMELVRQGVSQVVVTLGADGALVYRDGAFISVPARKVKAVDTTAAGDTFCGAVCVGLSEGLSLEEAAAFATGASALTVQKVGAQNSLPYRKDLTD